MKYYVNEKLMSSAEYKSWRSEFRKWWSKQRGALYTTVIELADGTTMKVTRQVAKTPQAVEKCRAAIANRAAYSWVIANSDGMLKSVAFKYANRIRSIHESRQFHCQLSLQEMVSELLFGESLQKVVRQLAYRNRRLSPERIAFLAMARISRRWLEWGITPWDSRGTSSKTRAAEKTLGLTSQTNDVAQMACDTSERKVSSGFGERVTALVTNDDCKAVMREVVRGSDVDKATRIVAKLRGKTVKTVQKAIQRERSKGLFWLNWLENVIVPVAERLADIEAPSVKIASVRSIRPRRIEWNHETIADNGVIAFATCGKEFPQYAPMPIYDRNADLPSGFERGFSFANGLVVMGGKLPVSDRATWRRGEVARRTMNKASKGLRGGHLDTLLSIPTYAEMKTM